MKSFTIQTLNKETQHYVVASKEEAILKYISDHGDVPVSDMLITENK